MSLGRKNLSKFVIHTHNISLAAVCWNAISNDNVIIMSCFREKTAYRKYSKGHLWGQFYFCFMIFFSFPIRICQCTFWFFWLIGACACVCVCAMVIHQFFDLIGQKHADKQWAKWDQEIEIATCLYILFSAIDFDASAKMSMWLARYTDNVCSRCRCFEPGLWFNRLNIIR
jgi:hypothetical protein